MDGDHLNNFIRNKYGRRATVANMSPKDPMWWPTMIRQTFDELNDARDEITDMRLFLMVIMLCQFVLVLAVVAILVTLCTRERQRTTSGLSHCHKLAQSASGGLSLVDSPNDSSQHNSHVPTGNHTSAAAPLMGGTASSKLATTHLTGGGTSKRGGSASLSRMMNATDPNLMLNKNSGGTEYGPKMSRRTRIMQPPVTSKTPEEDTVSRETVEHIFDDIASNKQSITHAAVSQY